MSLVPLEEAQRRVLAQCLPLRPLAIPLADALGCVTSVAIAADEDVPPWANSAVDGFAVRAADVPGTLTVVGTIPAGARPEPPVGPGEAVRILTGAPVPPGGPPPWRRPGHRPPPGRSGRPTRRCPPP